MLALALERISQANSRPDDVRIFVDTTTEHRLGEVKYVRDTYLPEALIFHARPHVQVPSGMWNILNSLKQGYQTGAESVYLIEEDVLVHPHYFDWHDSQTGWYLASCGRKQRNSENKTYTNPGSCFRRDMLALVTEHIVPELFADRRSYMDRTFGTIDEFSDLDDGLVRRIQKVNCLEVLYPEHPTCSHIGFKAYNHYAGWINDEGPIEKRIEILQEMLKRPTDRWTSDLEWNS